MAFAGVENARGDSHATAYVSNTGQSDDGDLGVSTSTSQAQQFTTGAQAGGYSLGSVGIEMATQVSDFSNLTVSIYSSVSNKPGNSLHTMTNPTEAVSADNEAIFTISPSVTLEASTPYFVVVAASTSLPNIFNRTNSDSEDSGTSTGWSIRNERHFLATDIFTDWSTNSSALLIAVYPPTATDSTDATLDDLNLTDSSSNNVTLSPTFQSSTTSYTATVDEVVEVITVTPTTNDTDASYVFLDGSDTALEDAADDTDGHQVSLDVGDTTFKVKVTAEDAVTTETYTVTVTRLSDSLLVTNADVTGVGSLNRFIGARQNGASGQRITSGDHPYGYTVTSVGIYVNSVAYTGSETVTLRIHEFDENECSTTWATWSLPSRRPRH